MSADGRVVVSTRDPNAVERDRRIAYYNFRTFLLNRTYTDNKIASAISCDECEAYLFTIFSARTENMRSVFEKAQYGHKKSIVQELKEMYPKPFKIAGYLTKNRDGPADECYEIKIKWKRKRAKSPDTADHIVINL